VLRHHASSAAPSLGASAKSASGVRSRSSRMSTPACASPEAGCPEYPRRRLGVRLEASQSQRVGRQASATPRGRREIVCTATPWSSLLK